MDQSRSLKQRKAVDDVFFKKCLEILRSWTKKEKNHVYELFYKISKQSMTK